MTEKRLVDHSDFTWPHDYKKKIQDETKLNNLIYESRIKKKELKEIYKNKTKRFRTFKVKPSK